ncbi:hypothetical protein ONZ43_g4710 [Nemania bipapillata]|uniref:Uncharacterized protein n=1 Tax=Nemania bipapillata TaxID=110536 RepID=A0ACC2IJA5_9PEZI|nr:hypothetical protein ONZ43_g4710 [Nemania bipapillata]
MDCVEKLFEGLEGHESSLDLGSARGTAGLFKLLEKFIQAPASSDPDYHYLLDHAKAAIEPGNGPIAYFRQQLAHLATQKPINRKDKSIKACKLKFYRWLAQGMKAETYPFERGPNGPPTTPSTIKLTALISPTDCAACGKEDVHMRCPDCNFSNDILLVEKTVYCNKKCLQNHRNAHKSKCDSRKMLYRAIALLDYIFIALGSSTYLYPVSKIFEENGIVYMVDDSWDRAGMTGRSVFYPFPAHLSPSPEFCRALLLWGLSEEVGLSIYPLITYLLKPMCKSIDQVHVQLRNVIRSFCQLSEGRALNMTLYKHMVLKLTLKSNEEYVVNLTGSQFGFKEILAPWAQWVGLRGAKLDMASFKPTRGNVRMVITHNTLEGHQLEVRSMVVESIITELNRAVHANKEYETFSQILRGPVQDYARAERDVKSMVNQRIFMLIKNECYRDRYRLYLSSGPDPDIDIANNNAKILRKLWMSTKEYERRKNKGEDLRKIWQERVEGKLNDE